MGRRKNSKKDKVESPEVLKATNKKDIETGSISDSRISTSNASTMGSTHNGSISTSADSSSDSDDEDDEEEEEDEKVSLRSRTFDLREFSGMGQQQQEGNVRSSSPSVADTIIARGVEYGAPVVVRYLQAPNDPHVKTPPGILLNQAAAVAVAGSRNSVGGVNKIPELQPEEFLNVDPRHLAIDSHQRHHHHHAHDPGSYRSPNRTITPPTQQYYQHQQNTEFSSVPQLNRPMNGYKRTSFDDFEAYRQGQQHHPDIPRHSLQNGVQHSYNEQYEHGQQMKSDAPQQNGGGGGPKNRKKYNKKREHKKQVKEPEVSQPGVGEILSGTILGDAPLIRDFLGKRQRDFAWSPVIFLECFFRSVGSVVFASNPWSGLAIYCAMLGVIPLATLIGSITLIVSIITAIFLVQMRLHSVRAGGITFNGFLLGVVIGQFADLTCPGTYATAILSGFVIVYLHCALEGLLKPLNLPLLNSPFNLAAFIFFTSGIADMLKAEPSSSSSSAASDDPYSFHGVDFRNYGNLTMENMTTIKGTTETGTLLTIPMIIEGAVFATAQIFGTRTGIASFVVTAAIFVFSPILCAQATVGAFVGTLIGSGLDDAPFTAVTSGDWAYNSLLSCAALGGFLIVLSIQSWILSVIGAVLSALVYGAMSKGNMPVLGIPFMLMTWLLVACTNINSSLTTGLPNGARGTKKWMAMVKVSEQLIQTPEIHLQQFWKREPRMRRKIMPQQEGGGGERYDRPEAELHL